MNERSNRQNIPGYVSIKEAAKILGISANRVYAYVEEGRLSSAKAAHVIMIPLEEVKNFKPHLSGRPRSSIPLWRISPDDNTLLVTMISAQVKSGQHRQLMRKLEEIKREKRHLFLGTVARYIMESEVYPDRINIMLIWRITMMPDEASCEQALDDFRQALTDVLDWNTARYDTGRVVMHT
jgi:excisionase family DNA binding protein